MGSGRSSGAGTGAPCRGGWQGSVCLSFKPAQKPCKEGGDSSLRWHLSWRLAVTRPMSVRREEKSKAIMQGPVLLQTTDPPLGAPGPSQSWVAWTILRAVGTAGSTRPLGVGEGF